MAVNFSNAFVFKSSFSFQFFNRTDSFLLNGASTVRMMRQVWFYEVAKPLNHFVLWQSRICKSSSYSLCQILNEH